MPRGVEELLSADNYGPLPCARGVDIFSKRIELYPLRVATTKACLKKIMERYVVDAVKPRSILSDHLPRSEADAYRVEHRD